MGIEEQEKVVHKFIVALPQVAHFAEEFHIGLHIHAFDGAHIGCRHGERARTGGTNHLIIEQKDIPIFEHRKIIHPIGLQKERKRFAIESVLGLRFQSLQFSRFVPSHNVELTAMIFVFKKELSHIERMAHHHLFAHDTGHPLCRGLQVFKGVFHQIELSKRARNGGARILRQSAIRVFNLSDIVVGVRLNGNPVG